MNKKIIVSLALFVGFVIVLITITESSTNYGLKVSLGKPLPLKLRYESGETLYYRLIRRNTDFKMDGSKFGELKAVAYFTRTRVENDNQGGVREEFTWKSFSMGQSMMPNRPIKMSYLKEAENFSLILSVEDEDVLHKLDFSELPRSLEGLWFMIMAWDAITFDGPVRAQKHFKFPDSALIGTETHDTRGPWEFTFEYPPLVTDSKYFFSGRFYSKVTGISLEKNIPCAVIEFQLAENKVLMNLILKPVKVKSRAFEHIWGKTYLSLEDGRIVRGELRAPTLIVQDLWMLDQEKPTHSEYFVLQKLGLELLSAEEFDFEVRKLREAAERNNDNKKYGK